MSLTGRVYDVVGGSTKERAQATETLPSNASAMKKLWQLGLSELRRWPELRPKEKDLAGEGHSRPVTE